MNGVRQVEDEQCNCDRCRQLKLPGCYPIYGRPWVCWQCGSPLWVNGHCWCEGVRKKPASLARQQAVYAGCLRVPAVLQA